MKKRALLVAINYVGTSNELHGCINDSTHMKDFLTARGFTDIKQILEKEATTSGIKAGLAWLTADTQSGDVIVFHYSGHGSQIPSSVEPDGFEEIICPIDLDWLNKVISDNDLRKIFNKVPNGVNTTVILDSCHSGTMLNQTESLNGTKELVKPASSKKTKGARYLKPPTKIVNQLKTRTLVDWTASKDINASALLIAGCHADQTSADAVINGVPQGAATAALLAAASNTSITYRNLILSMDSFMKTNGLEQVPELDGSPTLYDQQFVEPFNIVITSAPIESTSPIVSVEPTQSTGIFEAIINFFKSLFSHH
jgi:hypothetical protein